MRMAFATLSCALLMGLVAASPVKAADGCSCGPGVVVSSAPAGTQAAASGGRRYSYAPGRSYSYAPARSYSVAPGRSYSVAPGRSYSVAPGRSYSYAPEADFAAPSGVAYVGSGPTSYPANFTAYEDAAAANYSNEAAFRPGQVMFTFGLRPAASKALGNY